MTQITSQVWKGVRGQRVSFDAAVTYQRVCHVLEVPFSFSHRLSQEIHQFDLLRCVLFKELLHFHMSSQFMLANYMDSVFVSWKLYI